MTAPLGPPPRRRLVVRFAVAAALLAALTVAVADQTFLPGEVGLLRAVNGAPRWAGAPTQLLMHLGTWPVAVLAVVVVAWCTLPARWAPTAALVLAAAVAFRLDNVMKAVVERPRPSAVLTGLDGRDHIGGFGFPSGHTTMAFALAAALHPTLPARWRPVAWLLAVAVGVGRMYVGAHWPADVVGGAALGTAIGSAAWLAVGAVAGRERQ